MTERRRHARHRHHDGPVLAIPALVAYSLFELPPPPAPPGSPPPEGTSEAVPNVSS